MLLASKQTLVSGSVLIGNSFVGSWTHFTILASRSVLTTVLLAMLRLI